MTKKHMELVASIINAAGKGTPAFGLAALAAAEFKKANPRFESGRFFSACGLTCDGAPKPKRVYGLENHAL
tara:strand:+ start:1311 stop:1523 length:213 start_codon:yes stop_codon:yes gene_type:complete